MARRLLWLLPPAVALAFVALAPTAAADPDPEDPETLVPALLEEREALMDEAEEAERLLDRMFSVAHLGPNGYVEYEASVECHIDSSGQRACWGRVCTPYSGEGTLPVNLGQQEEDLYGVGVDPFPDEDGHYGPYYNVYFSPGGACGCDGVVLQWTLP